MVSTDSSARNQLTRAAHFLYKSAKLLFLRSSRPEKSGGFCFFWCLMPVSAPRPCRHSGCGKLVGDGSGYCPAHQSDRKHGQFGDSRRGSRHERGYGSEWDKIRKLIMVRDDGLCQPCMRANRITVATQVDHVINKAEWKIAHGSLTGVDAQTNLQAICGDCHKTKTQSESTQARRGRGGKKPPLASASGPYG